MQQNRENQDKASYNEFKHALVRGFEDHVRKYCKEGVQVIVRAIPKINHTEEQISVIPKGMSASPSYNILDFYEDYLSTPGRETEPAVLASIRKYFSMAGSMNADYKKPLNPTYAKDRLIFHLVNEELSREFLKDKPHRSFHGMAVMYRVEFEQDGMGYSVPVTSMVAEQYKMDEQELFKTAYKNTTHIYPPRIGMLIPKDAEKPDSRTSFLVDNEAGEYASAYLLYDELLAQLAKKSGSDLYILPLSIDYFIAAGTGSGTPEHLSRLYFPEKGELPFGSLSLSRQIYLYNRKEHEITCITGDKGAL